MTLDVKKSNSSNETPNVMTVGVEKYGPNRLEQGNTACLGNIEISNLMVSGTTSGLVGTKHTLN
jgi:hypothetical protein